MRHETFSRQTKGEITRQSIIECAATVFNRHGFEGSTMAQLMAATGLKKGGLYNHFGSKEELAIEALSFAMARALENHLSALRVDGTTAERLKNMVRNFRNADAAGGCPMVNTAIDSDDGNQALRKLARAAAWQWQEAIETAIQRGIAGGDCPPDVDRQSVAGMLIAMLEGALTLARLHGDIRYILRAEVFLCSYIDNAMSRA